MRERYKDTYTAFDVETPNCKNDSICSIGIVRVEEGKTVFAKHYYVDPEDRFDYRNIEIHGITPNMVRGHRNFAGLWSEISPYFWDNVLLAHNANFDLRVLSKCLSNYELEVPDFFHLCTLKLSKFHYKDLGHHRLNDMCDFFNLKLLNHHNALDDAMACEEIFRCIRERNKITYEDVEIYRMDSTYIKEMNQACLTKSMNELSGLIKGFAADDEIDALEMVRLERWIRDHRKFKKSSPFCDIIPVISGVLNDGYVSKEEQILLLRLAEGIRSQESYTGTTTALQEFRGLLEGIGENGEIAEKELVYLQEWMQRNGELRGSYPYDDILLKVQGILSGQGGSTEGLLSLKRIFGEYLDPLKNSSGCCNEYQGKTVCLTGNFSCGSKDQVASRLERLGAAVTGTVTKKTDILIVGGEGSADWSFGNYGTKVKKAMEMKNKGGAIEIISEEELMKFLDGMLS